MTTLESVSLITMSQPSELHPPEPPECKAVKQTSLRKMLGVMTQCSNFLTVKVEIPGHTGVICNILWVMKESINTKYIIN